MKADLPIVGDYGISVAPQLNSETTINYYIEYDEDGKKPSALVYTPGILEDSVVEPSSVSVCRTNGQYSAFGLRFIVINQNLYSYTTGGTKTFIASLITDVGYISWANTNSVIGQLAIADGVELYIYNYLTNVFVTTNLATLFLSPQMVYFQDARFFVSCSGSSEYPFSAQGNGTSWNALNFIVQQSRPDVSMGISGTNERVFLFGEVSVEIQTPVQNPSDLPLYRDNNLLFEIGNASLASIIKGTLDNQLGQPVIQFIAWLATNTNGGPSFVLSTGGAPIKVSSKEVDILIGSNGFDVSDCYGVIYKEAGHTFILWSFNSEDVSLVYDVTVGKWIESQRLDGSYSLINSHTWFNNRHYVGSRLSSTIYLLSRDFLTENGEAIKRTRVTKTFCDPSYNRIICNWLEVDFEAGTTDPSVIPYAFMSFSVDGGISWSQPRKAPIGQTGQYQYKTYWRMLGSGYSFTFKIEVYDPIRVVILGAAVDYELLTT